MSGNGRSASGPLVGVRVLDFGSYIAGPYGAAVLGDLGADVIKVESVGGDLARHWGPFLNGESRLFQGYNRNKRSVAVDLRAPAGRDIAHALARTADVAIENMRPGIAARLGVDWPTLRAINPRLIHVSSTAFGNRGPYRDRPGFDPLLQAMSGAQALQGFGGPPQYIRIAITDYYAASLAAQAVLAALFVRERTGQGQRVETSLMHAALALQSGNFVDYPGKQHVFRDNPTYRLYQAADGQWFFLACGNQTFWVKLCAAMKLEHLAEDPRFASWMLRLDNREALLPLLEKAFGREPRAHWLRVLAEHDIPAAPVQTLLEFMDDPALRHHDLVREYQHPDVGRLRMLGQPLVFSETRTQDPGPPPALAQHTTEILTALGYDETAIADLRARRVIK